MRIFLRSLSLWGWRMFLGFDSYGNGIVFSWISGLVFSFRSGDLVMLVLLVRLRILYVSVIVYSYNEKNLIISSR